MGESTVQLAAPLNGDRVDLLERDRELALALAPALRGRHRVRLWAETMKLEGGPWDPGADPPSEDHLGFLMLEGLLGRRVLLPDRGRSLELLGTGDLLRPWHEDTVSFTRVAWTVFEPSLVAVLDGSLGVGAQSMSALLETLTERVLRRSRRLAVSAAIANTVGVEDRLVLILWQLAELWGEKRPGGALLRFNLSHQTLADLVGARRPTVTVALSDLAERGLVHRDESGGWMLAGSPP